MSDNQPQEDGQVQIDPETGFIVPQEGDENQPGAASLDQVREILFGNHTRNLETRLSLVEDRLDRVVSKLTDDVAARIDALDRFIKNELTMLLEKLGVQREERSALFQQVQNEIDSTGKRLDKKIGEVSERMSQMQSESRAELLRQINTVTEDVEKRTGAISDDLTAETSHLRTELVDRGTFSALLSELALRMSNQTDFPDVDPSGEGIEEALNFQGPDSE